MGFSIKLAPGVRIRASSRGLRASLGPRVARVHVGAGRPGLSTGIGPVGFYASLGAGRARTGTSVARYQGQLASAQRRFERAEEWQRLAEIFRHILDVHRVEFPPAQRPIAPPPQHLHREAIAQRLEREALTGIGLFQRAARARARQDAQKRTEAEVQRLTAESRQQQAHLQNLLDERWQQLRDNDPNVVMETLEEAFEDNEAPAAAIAVSNAEVALVVLVPDIEHVVPERMPAQTSAGNLTFRALAKGERVAFFKQFVCGQTLATVREAFAVAPGLTAARVVVLRRDPADAYGRSRLACLLAAVFDRRSLEQVRWNTADAAMIVNDASSELLMVERGRTRELAPLDLSHEPALADLIRNINLDADDLDGGSAELRSAVADAGEDAALAAASRGDELYEAGDLRAAQQAYRSAIEFGDREWGPYAADKLGDVLLELGDAGGARGAYQRAIDSGHDIWAPTAMRDLGDLLHEQYDFDDARAAYERAIASGYERVVSSATIGLGNVLRDLGDLDGARAAYQRVIDSGDEWVPHAEGRLAGLLRSQGDLDGARAAYQRVIDSGHPGLAPFASSQLGRLLCELGDLEDARAAYQRALDSVDASAAPGVSSGLGDVLRELGDLQGARTAYQRAIDSGHEFWADYAATAVDALRHQRDERDGSLTDDPAAKTVGRGNVRAATVEADRLSDEGDVYAAEEAYRAVIAAGDPEWGPYAAYRLGDMLLLEQGDLDAARAGFQQAVDSQHTDWAPCAALRLGQLLSLLGDLDGAEAAYQKAVDSRHASWAPVGAICLGDLHRQRDNFLPAQRAYSQAIDMASPTWTSTAANCLGKFLLEQGDFDGAGQAYQLAVDSGRAEEASEAFAGLGRVLEAKGDLGRAVEAYERAVGFGDETWAPFAAERLADIADRR